MFPKNIFLEPTNFCNFKCIMCPHGYNGMVKNKGFMNFELFKKIIDDCRLFPDIVIALYNTGESLMHKNIVDMCRYASQAGLKTVLNTNGSLLTPELSEGLASSSLEKISFSFEGEDQAHYEKIRVNGNYKEILENIFTFLNLNKDRVSVTIQLLRFNEEDNLSPAPEFKKLFKGYNIKYYVYRSGSWKGDLKEDSAYKPTKERLSPEVCQYYRDKVMTIGWNGVVRGCCIDYNAENPLGDVRTSSVQEVWLGAAHKKLRDKIYALEYEDIPLCKKCDAPYQIREDNTSKYFEKDGVVKIGYRPKLIE